MRAQHKRTMTSDHYTSGSDLLPWPLSDFSTPLSCPLHEVLQSSSSFMGSNSSALQSPSLNPFPVLMNSPPVLSSPASMGASTGKVTKRKSRAATKPPIKVLSADRATFRHVVQKHTGISNLPSMRQAGQRRWWGAASNLSVVPQPVDGLPGSHNDLKVAAHQSMPMTLDTSSLYLARGYNPSSNTVYNEVGKSRLNSPYEAEFDPTVQSGLDFDLSGRVVSFDPKCGVQLPGRYTTVEGKMGMNMESLRRLHRASELAETLLQGSNNLEDVLQSNRIDQLLFSDLLRTPSPTVEAHRL